MRRRTLVASAAILWFATLAIGLATLWTAFTTNTIQVVSGANDPAAFQVTIAALIAVSTGYGTVGLLLVGRVGASRMGVLLVSGGLLFALIFFGYLVGIGLVLEDPQSAVFNAIVLLGPVTIGPGFALILPAVAIAFPDGGLPSPRWRWPVGVVATMVGLGTFLEVIHPGPILSGPVATRNPFGIDVLPAAIDTYAGILIDVGVVAATALGVTAAAVRFLRGDQVERQQQRWFMAAVSLAAIAFVLSILPVVDGPTLTGIAAAGLLLIPIAVGIAVTRYHLYEIDHLINRTLVYVPLTALLAGLYAATVTLLQRLFQSVTGDRSDAAIIISTLILASVFTPIRKWLETIVEHRFKPAGPVPTPLDHGSVPDWEARMSEIAVRAVRAELDARAVAETGRLGAD